MLITGAGGMVRVKATDYFCEEYAVTPLTRTTLFITDHEALKQIFQPVKPAIVLNCVVVRNGTNSLQGKSSQRACGSLPYSVENVMSC